MRFLINLIKFVQNIIIFASCNLFGKSFNNFTPKSDKVPVGRFADLSAKL